MQSLGVILPHDENLSASLKIEPVTDETNPGHTSAHSPGLLTKMILVQLIKMSRVSYIAYWHKGVVAFTGFECILSVKYYTTPLQLIVRIY